MAERRAIQGVVAGALAIGVVLMSGSPAAAADIPIDFTGETGTQQTVEYGDYWYFDVQVGQFIGSPGQFTVNDGSGAEVHRTAMYAGGLTQVGSWIYDEPLDAGEYQFTASIASTGYPDLGTTDTPARLTIEPAALAVEVLVETDASQPANAVISARMTGDYLQRMDEGFPASLPAGTWSVTVLDETGATAFEDTTDQISAGDPFASFYWTDVPRGTDFTATATFAPTEQQQNFTVSPSIDFPYTSSAADAGEDGAPPTSQVAPGDEANGWSVPLWVLAAIGAGALLVLLAEVVLAFLLLRRRRRRRIPPAPQEDVAAEREEVLQDA